MSTEPQVLTPRDRLEFLIQRSEQAQKTAWRQAVLEAYAGEAARCHEEVNATGQNQQAQVAAEVEVTGDSPS